MRFAIAATDRYLAVARALVEVGWTPVKLFASKVDGRLDKTKAVLEWAEQARISAQLSRLGPSDLQRLRDDGCDALVVASYCWRIPEWREQLRYAVNFHPSPLPEARGPDPTVRALLEARASWAVSCHKIEREFDTGDILAAETFALSPNDDREVLDLKIQLASARLARRVATDFVALWSHARPQEHGSYWPRWTREQRVLDFSCSVAELRRQLQAFGEIGCIALVNQVTIFVKRASAWSEPHPHAPGTVVHEHDLRFVLAAKDGYVAVTEWSILENNNLCQRTGP